MDEDGAEIAKLEGITEAGVLTPTAAAAARAAGENVPDLVSEDGEVAYVYFTFNLGKEGWNKISDPAEEIHDFAKIDGVDVYVAGFGGQAYDFVELVRRLARQPAVDHVRRGDPDPVVHLPQPDPLAAPDHLRGSWPT